MFRVSKQIIDQVAEFEQDPAAMNAKIATFSAKFEQDEWFLARPAHIQAAFRKYPVTGFYRVISSDIPTRITGFHETADGQIRAQTHIPLMGMSCLNATLGGRDIDEIELVEKWSDADIENIQWKTMANPDLQYIFRHPFGAFWLAE